MSEIVTNWYRCLLMVQPGFEDRIRRLTSGEETATDALARLVETSRPEREIVLKPRKLLSEIEADFRAACEERLRSSGVGPLGF